MFCKIYFWAVLHLLFLPCKFCHSHVFSCTSFVKLYYKILFTFLWLHVAPILLLNFVQNAIHCYWLNNFILLIMASQKAYINCILFSVLWVYGFNSPLHYTFISWITKLEYCPVEQRNKAVKPCGLVTHTRWKVNPQVR